MILNKFIVLVIIFLSLPACTRTENGFVFGTPAYEQRDISVSTIDLDILIKAKALLSDKLEWSRDVLRECTGHAPFSLYCALETASKIVDGKYIHRRPALQEVRFTIDDQYKSRWKVHRLAEFNNNPETSYEDIVKIMNDTIDRVREKIKNSNSQYSAVHVKKKRIHIGRHEIMQIGRAVI